MLLVFFLTEAALIGARVDLDRSKQYLPHGIAALQVFVESLNKNFCMSIRNSSGCLSVGVIGLVTSDYAGRQREHPYLLDSDQPEASRPESC
jgi:hypothetical protein